MNQSDARNFILALNAIAPYVPPMLMQPLMTNPICQIIEHMANTPDKSNQATQGDTGSTQERPKPHVVS